MAKPTPKPTPTQSAQPGVDPALAGFAKALQDAISGQQGGQSVSKMPVYMGMGADGKTPITKTVQELKAEYLTVPQTTKDAIAQFLRARGQKVSDSAVRTVWGQMVEASAYQYGQEKSSGATTFSTPLDVLNKATNALASSGGYGLYNTPPQVYHIDQTGAQSALNIAALQNGYAGKFTAKDYNQFMNDYNAAAARNPASYRVINGVQYMQPSSFTPTDFTKHWLWAHANVSDPNLRGDAATTLSQLQAIAANNNLPLSQMEIQAAAKNVLNGTGTIDSYKQQWGQMAVSKYYPSLSDRMQATPGATVRDLLDPYISTIANTLELSPSQISLNDPLLHAAMGNGGTDGKDTSLSMFQLQQAAMNDPRWQKTSTANKYAADAAVAVARGFGFGV